MDVILKVYATVVTLLWMAGISCLFFDKLESKAYDIISTIMVIFMGIGIIGLIVFSIWSLWKL